VNKTVLVESKLPSICFCWFTMSARKTNTLKMTGTLSLVLYLLLKTMYALTCVACVSEWMSCL